MNSIGSTPEPAPKLSRAPRRPNQLDVEILRGMSKMQYARGPHLAAWTGASPWTIRHRLRGMADRGEIASFAVGPDLRDPVTGEIRPSQTVVYRTTAAGGRAAGEWIIPGRKEPVSFPRGTRGTSCQTGNDVCAMADLACWYRSAGFLVITRREIQSTERAFVLAPDRPRARFWAVQIPGRGGIHVPSLGVVDADGLLWCVELEQALKPVSGYIDTIRAYRAETLGQVWHVSRKVTKNRILTACKKLDVKWAPRADGTGVLVSVDGMIRLTGFAPWTNARSGRGPAGWPRMYRGMPAGFPEPSAGRPDLTASWRKENGL